jgi:hypothetical protein
LSNTGRIETAGYPFPKPDKEDVVILGEWWNANVYDLQQMTKIYFLSFLFNLEL